MYVTMLINDCLVVVVTAAGCRAMMVLGCWLSHRCTYRWMDNMLCICTVSSGFSWYSWK